MSFNGGNKFDYDRYLKHKEYFDNGLIELLEKYQSDKKKYKQQEEIYKATISKTERKRRQIHSYDKRFQYLLPSFSSHCILLKNIKKFFTAFSEYSISQFKTVTTRIKMF